jgi:hypothetical protein
MSRPARLVAGFLTSDHGGNPGELAIACPVCGFYYSHIREALTRVGTDVYEAEVYAGTVAGGTATGERRSALVIVFDGECGHAWEVSIQQHKGINFVEVRPRDDQKEYR